MKRFGVAVVGLLLACVVVSASAQILHNGQHEVIRQQDDIKAFNLAAGTGYQTGTATGAIAGTTYVEFHYAPAGPPTGDTLPVTFSNKVIITDIDGDQLRFDNGGTGQFHLGIPGFPFQGSGGPMTGTYVLTSATGKYASLAIGTELVYRAVLTNPPNGTLGTVYIELTAR